MKKCPFCAEQIQDEAIICRFCQRTVATGEIAAAVAPRAANPGVAAVMSFFIPGLGQIYGGRVGMGLIFLLLVITGYIVLILPGLVLHIVCIVDAYNSLVPSRPRPATDPAPPPIRMTAPPKRESAWKAWAFAAALLAAVGGVVLFFGYREYVSV